MEAAKRFGYTPGSFRVMVHQLRKYPHRQFFAPPKKGRPRAPEKQNARQLVVALRKQNLSIYDISEALKRQDRSLSPGGAAKMLREEGFARLPRRRDDERPSRTRPEVADVANVRRLDLSPRHFRTRFGGLFLFVPYLASLGLDRMMNKAGLPGSEKVPAGHAIRSLLALKLFGSARHSHVMSMVLDEGLALFAGLNVIPFHGEAALVERHYVSRRSRRQKGVLAFLAQDADEQVFCYGNADLRRDEQNDEILRFLEYWQNRTGRLPKELMFDSKLTTYANFNKINKQGVRFITLRRRSRAMLEALYREPRSAWRRIELQGVSRIYRTPRVLDQPITLSGYEGPLRQLAVADLGHEEPTLILTNQPRRSAAKLVESYARRMLIENNIQDGVDFFHMDALSSAVAMKVNCDLQLTLMGSSLYRLLGRQIGEGYETAKSRHIFRDLVDATAYVSIEEREVVVRFQKRAHNPLLLAAGFDKMDPRIPWLGRKKLRLLFG